MVAVSAATGLQTRLDYLRRRGGDRSFLTEAATSGGDRTGAITLEVDASGWVLSSRVASLDGIRADEAFVSAVRQAYLAAGLARLVGNAEQRRRGAPDPTPAERERGEAVLDGRRALQPPPRPHMPRWELPRTPVADTVVVPGPDAGQRLHTGTSREGEISVHATVARGLSEIRLRPGWLADAGVEIAHYALREAFDDLRETFDRSADPRAYARTTQL